MTVTAKLLGGCLVGNKTLAPRETRTRTFCLPVSDATLPGILLYLTL